MDVITKTLVNALSAGLPEVRPDAETYQRDTRSLILSDATPPAGNNFERRRPVPNTPARFAYVLKNAGGLSATERKALTKSAAAFKAALDQFDSLARDKASSGLADDLKRMASGDLSPLAIVSRERRLKDLAEKRIFARQRLAQLGREDYALCAPIYERMAAAVPAIADKLEADERALSGDAVFEPSPMLWYLKTIGYKLAATAAEYKVASREAVWPCNPGKILLEADATISK